MKTKPRVFIGSSAEGVSIAHAIQENLQHDLEVTAWSQGAFELSQTTMESLMVHVTTNDFAIFVFSPDDVVIMRKDRAPAVRDNVLFEMGLFIGKLGRERVFFIMPKQESKEDRLRLPTDLLGVTYATYDPTRTDGNLPAATGPACTQIQRQAKNLGQFKGRVEVGKPDETESPSQEGDWLTPFVENNFPEAKRQLEVEISKVEGKALDRHKAWLLYVEYKIDDSVGFDPMQQYSKDNPYNATIHKLIALFMHWEGFYDQTIQFLNGLDPSVKNHSEVILAYSACYAASGDLKSARSVISEEAYLKYPELAIRLADIHVEEKDSLAAFSIIRTALARTPNNETLRYKCARLAADLGHHSVALYLLHRLVVDFPDSAEYWGYLGNECLALELNDQAIIAYRQSDKLYKGDADWIQGNIGNLLINRGLPSEAIGPLNRALELVKDSQYSLQKLAKALGDKESERSKLLALCTEGQNKLRKFDLPIEPSETLNPLLASLLSAKEAS